MRKKFYLECLKMWLPKFEPRSQFISAIGFIIIFLGAILWIMGRFRPTLAIEVGSIIFWIGVAIAIGYLLFEAPYQVWKKDAPLRKIKTEQTNNEQEWLYLVVEKINLDKIPGFSEREIQIQFKIINALVYDFRPHAIWVNLKLGGYEPREQLFQITPAPKLFQGRPYATSTMRLTVKDDGLFENVKKIRNGTPMEREFQVEIQPTPDRKTFLLRENF